MARYFGLVPAAGSGTRMGNARPKQYLTIGARPLLWYALRHLCTHRSIRRTFVVLRPDDEFFGRHDWSEFGDALLPLFCGGASRAESVMRGLESMHAEVRADDWVLVHDAARPCLTAELIDRLVIELEHDQLGGLLAIPLADTLKRDDGAHRVLRSEPRDQLWQAQTPQMFRYAPLLGALQAANLARTSDEASAIELLGQRPRLVMGSAANLKVTRPEDLALAERILRGDPG